MNSFALHFSMFCITVWNFTFLLDFQYFFYLEVGKLNVFENLVLCFAYIFKKWLYFIVVVVICYKSLIKTTYGVAYVFNYLLKIIKFLL